MDAKLPDRIARMHQAFGSVIGRRCGECAHLVGHHYNRTFWKCVKARVSASAATDWRKKWPACGLFVEKMEA